MEKISSEPNTDVIAKALPEIRGSAGDAIGQRMSGLVKGRGIPGSSQDDQSYAAEHLWRQAIRKGSSDPRSVLKSLSPAFGNALTLALQNSPQAFAMAQFASQIEQIFKSELGKSITLTSPNSTGLVPFDLSAPTKLIYPVLTPLRNLLPRVPGQGTSHQAKVISSISGALPGGLATPANRISIPELPSGGGIAGSNWPNQLPSSGTQLSSTLNIPYRFMGLTEAVSWLAQFAGQGFDDAAGLASLILLQEMMLLEERALIGATSIALSAPGTPVLTARSPGTGESALSGITTNLYAVVTALNYYGETVASTAGSVAVSAGQVVDIALAPSVGALAYNVYLGTGTATPSNSGFHIVVGGPVGGYRFTAQGALPTTGATPPTADTGTAATTDFEGLIPTISGHSASGGSNIYPSGYQGSYVNQSVGDIFSENAINTGLQQMWDGTNGIFADPDDIWAEGGDLMRLAGSLANQSQSSTPNNYRIFINQSEVGGVRGGVAVSEYTNPITRKVIGLRAHPYYPQGMATALSYKLSMPWSNTGNIWEVVAVQDYLSIAWPVVDVTFRYSLFSYETLFTPAVQYNALWQGIQKSTVTNGGTYS